VKVTSIIFLFVSVALVLGGLFLMRYARNAAPSDTAIDGYAYNEDGSNVSEISFDENEITKYAITLSDCEIEIAGSSGSSYVSLSNFKPNQYKASISGKSLTVSDDISITDYISFDGTGVKFAGIWQTLLSEYHSFRNENNDQKSVTIYIDPDKEINQINLNITNCTLRLHDIKGQCDISITSKESSVELNNIDASMVMLDMTDSDASLLDITSDKLSYTLENGSIESMKTTVNTLTVVSDGLDVDLKDTDFRTLSATVATGNFSINTNYDITSYSRAITTNEGILYINGVEIGSSSTTDKDAEYVGSITINSESGNINVTFGTYILLPEVVEEPDDDGEDGEDSETGETSSEEDGN